jgi:hypothetical protein
MTIINRHTFWLLISLLYVMLSNITVTLYKKVHIQTKCLRLEFYI